MMLRRKSRTASRSRLSKPRRSPSPAPDRVSASSSPPTIGATSGDSASERLAFLVIQSPNGELARFLIVAVVLVALFLVAYGVMAVSIDATTAAAVLASSTVGAISCRLYRKRRRQTP